MERAAPFYRAVFSEGGKFDLDASNWPGSVVARHKWNKDYSPFAVANEYICGELGRYLGLPIPPMALTQAKAGSHEIGRRAIHSSLDFEPRGVSYFYVDPELFCERRPRLATGIILFDILIANSDRNPTNIRVNRQDAPKNTWLFDHENALFGARHVIGEDRLESLWDQVGVLNTTSGAGTQHCLLEHLPSQEYFNSWLWRIITLSRWFVHELCFDSLRLGVSRKQARMAQQFLLHRAYEMRAILSRNRSLFEAVKEWSTMGWTVKDKKRDGNLDS